MIPLVTPHRQLPTLQVSLQLRIFLPCPTLFPHPHSGSHPYFRVPHRPPPLPDSDSGSPTRPSGRSQGPRRSPFPPPSPLPHRRRGPHDNVGPRNRWPAPVGAEAEAASAPHHGLPLSTGPSSIRLDSDRYVRAGPGRRAAAGESPSVVTVTGRRPARPSPRVTRMGHLPPQTAFQTRSELVEVRLRKGSLVASRHGPEIRHDAEAPIRATRRALGPPGNGPGPLVFRATTSAYLRAIHTRSHTSHPRHGPGLHTSTRRWRRRRRLLPPRRFAPSRRQRSVAAMHPSLR